MSDSSLTLEAYHYAASFGWWVFQLAEGSNVPTAGSHGHLDATNDPIEVLALWRKRPFCNIGVDCGRSDLLVLDVDAVASLEPLVARHGRFPDTPTARSPSGGWHSYFVAPDIEIRNSTSRVGHKLDIRATGGFICAPPSVRRDGVYRWVRSPDIYPPATAPEWLVKLAQKPPPPVRQDGPVESPRDLSVYVKKAVDCELAELRAARVGTRNHTLNKVAFCIFQFCKAGALPADYARATLTAIALDIGLEQRAIDLTLRSAWQAAPARIIENV